MFSCIFSSCGEILQNFMALFQGQITNWSPILINFQNILPKIEISTFLIIELYGRFVPLKNDEIIQKSVSLQKKYALPKKLVKK